MSVVETKNTVPGVPTELKDVSGLKHGPWQPATEKASESVDSKGVTVSKGEGGKFTNGQAAGTAAVAFAAAFAATSIAFAAAAIAGTTAAAAFTTAFAAAAAATTAGSTVGVKAPAGSE